MRPLSWTLLALLLILVIIVITPNYYSSTKEYLQPLGIVLALIVLLVGMLLIRQMNRRLAELSQIATAIGGGDYTVRADDESDDAIGLLAREINRMAGQIDGAIGELEAQKAELRNNRAQLESQHHKLSRQYQQQSSFGTYLSAINTVDVNTIAAKSLAYLLELTSAQLGQVYAYDERSGALTKVSERGIDRRALLALGSKPSLEGLPAEVLARKEIVRIDHVPGDRLPSVNLGFASADLGAVIGLPVLFQERALGVVLIGALELPETDNEVMRAAQSAIDALGGALNNALTYKTVQHQALRLEHANQELLEADRLRSEFVANMSHELRTPLNSIIGFSGVLSKNRSATLSDKDLDYVEKINRNGKHLLGLINDILDLSKIEAGRMDLVFEPSSLAPLATEVVEMLQAQAVAKHLTLTVAAADDLPTISTDAAKLKQVLINLVGNAIKFTGQGGVELKLSEHEGGVRIDVTDSGIGIAADKLTSVFEPFRQADSGTTRRYGGTGLGLTITRSIVDMLGGRVDVRSEPDVGSTFTVILPQRGDDGRPEDAPEIIAPPPAPPAAPQVARPPPPDGDDAVQRVLVIDDDSDARELLSGYIEELGALPVHVADGEQALEIARLHRPKLITLDLMMPGIDGWEVLRRFKADPELAGIPIIIISIVAEKRQALVLGAMDALTKPIAQDDLLNLLARTLRGVGGRILAIDDNPEVLELYQTLLENQVSELRTAVNGKDALRVLQDFRPDLIFLDLMMPEMDGVTFLRVLRAERRLMNLPVVVVTAKALGERERRELEMRVVQVIQKGEDDLEEQLRGTLQQVLTTT